MSDIQSDPSHSPIPPPHSLTAHPPSKAKKFTANEPNRHCAKLTEAQQDHMFEWFEQTPAIYNTNHVKTNASKSLQMSYNHYKCLAINKNGLRLLTNMLRKQCENAILANFRSMFLIFTTSCEWPWMLKNTYECLAITWWSLQIGGELHL